MTVLRRYLLCLSAEMAICISHDGKFGDGAFQLGSPDRGESPICAHPSAAISLPATTLPLPLMRVRHIRAVYGSNDDKLCNC